MADSTWTGVIAVALDVPPGAQFNILIPVRMFLGALRSEVLVPCLTGFFYEFLALRIVSYNGAGKLLVNLLFLCLSCSGLLLPQPPMAVSS